MKKKDVIAILTFIFIFLIIYFILTKDGNIFGSLTDFKNQHYLIPDYFRKLFYDTKDIFPDFALNLGGGQNIYYFSYYGLLNPIILVSYLLPSVKMIDYLVLTNSLIVILSTILFYYYLKKEQFNFKTRFIVSFLFLCSGPLIFHAHRHVMFINYFPFLIMGFYGIDKYLIKNKSWLLILAVILMIFTSYYYSVSGIIVLFIYGIYKYLKLNPSTTFKNIILYIKKFILPFIISIMASMIIILPTLYTLFNGRESTTKDISFLKLITPDLGLLYDPYSIGLTMISLIALIFMFFNKKRENKFLTTICLSVSIFPLFNYILNGTLYINSKSLIPFMPLILIVVANYLNNFMKKNSFKQNIVVIYLLISSLIICIFTNLDDKLMKKEDINNIKYNTTIDLINEILEEDNDFYRISNLVFEAQGINNVSSIKEYKTSLYSSTYNNTYSNFYFDVFNNPVPHRNRLMTADANNILFQSFMNEKYIISEDELKLEKIKERNNIKVYKNNNALPLGYASKNTISNELFNKLNYPNNIINMFNNVIVEDGNNENIISLDKVKLEYEVTNYNNLEYKLENNIYKINAEENSKMEIILNEDMSNKLLFIRFKNMINPNYDTSITINGIQNKLTNRTWKYHNNNELFDYVIYDTNKLDILFSKGKYELSDFEFYVLNHDMIKLKNIDAFVVNRQKTIGDYIVGNISVSASSYFTISIPYDKGFKILVDNKKVEYEKTNASFIGFEIEKGNHEIIIQYEAPYKKLSIIISSIGLLSYLFIIIRENKRKNYL